MELISKCIDDCNKIESQMATLRRWGHLGESNFSRIYSIFTDPKYVAGMISAHTLAQELKTGRLVSEEQLQKFKDENTAYTIRLGMEFKEEGFGYKFIDGHWVYDDGKQKFEVEEDTLLVIAPVEKEADLFKSLVNKQIQYGQETFIFKNGKGEIKMFDARKSAIKPVMVFDKLNFDSLNTDFFSKLKTGSHAGRKFVFSANERSDGFSSSYMEHRLFEKLNISRDNIIF